MFPRTAAGIPPSTGMMNGGGGGANGGGVLPEGQYTTTIYSLVQKGSYAEASSLLSVILQQFPRSRAALSLLAYCDYMRESYEDAAFSYEQLVRLYPNVTEYRIAYAQTLYKAARYTDAAKIAMSIDAPETHQRVQKLLAAIHYEMDDLQTARSHVDEVVPDTDPDAIVAHGCLLYKEGKYEEARRKFHDALNVVGYSAQLLYAIAVCHYKQKQYGAALKHISEIIERGINEHPELSVGAASEGVDVRSVGNSIVLRETALIEAFNLKAAIEYMLKNAGNAAEALADMPPRQESELDAVTLCNQALMNMDKDATSGFAKLNFLLQSPPFPPETFGNLLLLYVKYGYYDLAADVLAENAHLTYKYLSQDLYDFLDAVITAQTSPEEAFRKFDDLATKHVDVLRKLTKQIQDSRVRRDSEGIKTALKEYDESLEKYIPVLMAMAKIFWDLENYDAVEKIFRQSSEFCSEHDTWKLNLAHTFFMQENKYKEAIRYYEPFVKKATTDVLSVPAIVLANLCVSLIMTSQNELAEELMRSIEREEERVTFGSGKAGGSNSPATSPGSPGGPPANQQSVLHLCIVNLVIGTLYCAKGNFEFGISRIIKSLEPYQQKLMVDTWFYAKRCFLALAEQLAKHMLSLKDASFTEILGFLDAADKYGKGIKTKIDPLADPNDPEMEFHTVSREARLLKKIFLQLRD
eukprot:ANDGO_03860.mRNA.1 Tetratricopeptide repeat protein 30 homolog